MHPVRFARLRAGLMQKELARRAGISQPALAGIESGRIQPRIDTIERLLNECDMTIAVLQLATSTP